MTAIAEHLWLDTGEASHELRTWHFVAVVREKEISKGGKKVQLHKHPDWWNLATYGFASCAWLWEKLHLELVV